MWVDRLLSSKVTDAIALSAQFAEQRHSVLSENIANLDTPDYHAKRLDVDAFQASLQEALDAKRPGDIRPLELRHNPQFQSSHRGLEVRPEVEPAPNVLFHDGTTARLEGLMSDVAGNTLMYEFSTNLLRTRFEGLLTAIRGRLR